MKLDADEKELRDSAERGEWKSAKGGKRERVRYSRYANRKPLAQVRNRPSQRSLGKRLARARA